MRILLVAPEYMGGVGNSHYPPVHYLYLASPLLAAGHAVRIFDCGAYPPEEADRRLRAETREFAPHLVGFTLYTPTMPVVHHLCTLVREAAPEARLILGGGHPSAAPADALDLFPMADFALRGEAEETLPQLVERLDAPDRWAEVPGLAWRRDGETVVNPGFGLVEDLARLPLPPRHLLDRYYARNAYWHLAAGGPVDMMISTRGCAFQCTFCFKLSRKTRYLPPDRVLAEMEDIVARGVRNIHIMDDAFTLKRDRAVTILEEILRRDLRLRLKIRSRVTSVDAEFLRLARRAGVETIVYGIESGSQTVLDCIEKGTTVEDNARVIRLTKAAGITAVADVMMGMPAETPATIEETVRFLKRTRPLVGYIPMLYPLPTTPVYEAARAAGTLQGRWLPDGSKPWVALPWAQTRGEAQARIHDATRRVHLSPGVALYFLSRTLPKIRLRHLRYVLRRAGQLLRG